MKTIIKILAVCFIPISAHSQNFQWADRIGGPDRDVGNVILDKNDNIIISGNFRTKCYFQDDTLESWGLNDLFLVKYDKNDNELWVKKIGGYNGYNFEYPGGFTIDKNDNSLYYSCSFYNQVSLPPCGAISNGESDLLLMKIDSNGNCLWGRHIGSSSFDDGGPVAIDDNGNLFWIGKLNSQVLFDTTFIPEGAFLAKLDPNGNVFWIRNEITNGNATCLYPLLDNIIMAGITYDDTIQIDTVSLISDNKIDCFLTKLNPDGSVIWAKRFGGNGDDYPGQFILDDEENIYLVGKFNDSINIDGIALVNHGRNDMFLAKFDTDGMIKWVKQSHSDGVNGALCFSIEMNIDSSSFYIAGTFSGNAIFGNIDITSNTVKDIFIAKYDLDGDCHGITKFGAADIGGVLIGRDGKLITSGYFHSTIQLGSNTFTSFGDADIFFAKLDSLNFVPEDNQKRENGLIIYTNPTTGKCNITIPEEFMNEDELILRIYDQMGKLVQEVKVENVEGTLRFDIRAQAKGLYHATLSNGRKVYSGKIVFE